jgi:hypothetical protein
MIIQILFSTFILTGALPSADPGVAPGSLGRYEVLSCRTDAAPPFESVELLYGPRGSENGTDGSWLAIRAFNDQSSPEAIFEVQVFANGDPLRACDEVPIGRYLLRVTDTGEALEYRNVTTGRALLPTWGHFQQHFLPHAAPGSAPQDGFPQTARYLGQVLTLREVRKQVEWNPMQAKRLDLDPDLLVGTARNFKDSEGHRIPQTPERKDYTYVRFTAEDYATMIEAGSSIFMVSPEQEPFVRDQPVFYHRTASGKPPLRWPVDCYRSNYLGPLMFMDEPAIIAINEPEVNSKLRFFSDFAAVVRGRVHAQYANEIFLLEKALRDRKVNLGDLRLEMPDIPIWEVLYESGFYQMAGGGAGFVHEGRYRLDNFRREVARRAGIERDYTAEEMLRYYYGVLRGATRSFGKHWGTSIYGQCDPEISEQAVKLAYDMGARYIWFWTSDHEYHLPWNEQMKLTRALRDHVREHPRASLSDPRSDRDVVILIPYGDLISLESLWFIRGLDFKNGNAASVRYQRLLKRAFQAVNEALDRHDDFDISVDDGRRITGYKRIVRIEAEP